MKKLMLCICIILPLAFSACGAVSTSDTDFSPSVMPAVEPQLQAQGDFAAADSSAGAAVRSAPAPEPTAAPMAPDTPPTPEETVLLLTTAPTIPEVPRMLIRTAGIGIDTEDFPSTVAGVEQIVARHGGFIESSQRFTVEGVWQAEYVLRVPVDTFDAVNAQLATLAHVRYFNTTSQDVSLEFFDTASRMRIREEELRRLETMLAAATTLTDIINLESQVTNLQLVVTSYQRRLSEMDNLASFSTIAVSLYEIVEIYEYEEAEEPEEIYEEAVAYIPIEDDHFGGRLMAAFGSSIGFITTILSGLALFLATTLPLAVVAFIIAYPTYRLLKKYGLVKLR